MKSSTFITLFGDNRNDWAQLTVPSPAPGPDSAAGSDGAAQARPPANHIASVNGEADRARELRLRSPESRELWDLPTREVTLASFVASLQSSSGVKQAYTAEQYRIIRTGLVQALHRPFLLAISSPGVADGKTFNAVNLAATLGMTGEGRTLLIDADLRGPSVHKNLHVDQCPGLAHVLTGRCPIQEAIVRVKELPALHVLPAGAATANPTDQFDSPAWQELAAAVRRRFAHVIVDCPPVGLFADFDLIAAVCDGVLAVIRPGHTDRNLCAAAMAKLRPKLTGVIVNSAEEWFFWKKSTRQYYSHYYTDGTIQRSRSPK